MTNDTLPSRAGGASRPPASWTLRSLLLRPEVTAGAGVVLAFVFFALEAGGSGFLSATGTQNYLEVAAEVGIIAVPVTLLLVANEFDLSVGAMMAAGGIVFAYPLVELGWPLWASVLLALAAAVIVGLVNGLLTVTTKIPSFLVTLASLFVLKGLTVAVTKSLVDTTSISGVTEAAKGDLLLPLFNGTVAGMSVSVVWWIGLTLIAAFLLSFTKTGNWIYATGGNLDAAVRAGIPVKRIKVGLFVATAAAAVLVAILATFAVDTADVSRGNLKEFQVVVAAVIGGAAITGGYGSPIGTAFGALFFGMVSQGFFFTDIDDNWFQAFLGVMLLLAVAVNTYARSLAMKSRRSK